MLENLLRVLPIFSISLVFLKLVVVSAKRNSTEGSHEEDDTGNEGDDTNTSVVAVLFLEGGDAVSRGLSLIEVLGEVEEGFLAKTGALEFFLELLEEGDATVGDEFLEIVVGGINIAASFILCFSRVSTAVFGTTSLRDGLIVASIPVLEAACLNSLHVSLTSLIDSELCVGECSVLDIIDCLIAETSVGAHKAVDVLFILSRSDLLTSLSSAGDLGGASSLLELLVDGAREDSTAANEGNETRDEGEDEVNDAEARVGPLAEAQTNKAN